MVEEDRAGEITTTSSGEEEECNHSNKAIGVILTKEILGVSSKEAWVEEWVVWEVVLEEEVTNNGNRTHSITRIRNGVKEDLVKCLSGRTKVMSMYHQFSSIKVAKSVMELVQ